MPQLGMLDVEKAVPVSQQIFAMLDQDLSANAIIWNDQKISAAMLKHRAKAVAAGLTALGLKKGDRVVYLGQNNPAIIELLLGAAIARAVLTPISWRLTVVEAQAVINDSRAKLVVVGKEFANHLQSSDDCHVLLLNDYVTGTPQEDDYAAWRNSYSGDGVVVQPLGVSEPEDIFVQLYTSGTTGLPKGVPQSHRNHLSTVAQWRDCGYGEWSRSDIVLCSLPMFHTSGLNLCLTALLSGATLIIHAAVDPDAILNDIARYHVTRFAAVPTLLLVLSQKVEVGRQDVSSIAEIAYGGSSISPELLARVRSVFGCNFVQIYASTETTGALTILTPEDHLNQAAGSCGRLSDMAEMKLVDPKGQMVTVGEVGEIWVRSESVVNGYWNNEQATRESFSDGWYHTGDLALQDQSGYVHIVDRSKDMIVTGGENVYPAELERLLNAYGALKEFSVIASPHDVWGEAVTIAVAGANDQIPDLEDVRAYLMPSVARYKLPLRLVQVLSMPRNAMGKILKRELRDQIRNGQYTSEQNYVGGYGVQKP